MALELSSDINNFTDGFLVDPNESTTSKFLFGHKGNVGIASGEFTRPSAAAWHHYVLNLDKSLSTNEAVSAYVDGTSQTLTRAANPNNTNAFGNRILYLMSRGGASLFGAGAIAEVAIYGGVNLSAAEAGALYNGGAGIDARQVRSADLKHYWRLKGQASPEPATVGSVAMTVQGATAEAHPVVGAVPDHAYAEVTSVQTATSTTFADISGAEIPASFFVAGKKYLIVAAASARLGTAGNSGNLKMVHGSTEFAESEEVWFATAASDSRRYRWLTVWTAVDGEAIKMQHKKNNTADQESNTITLFALRLTDFFRENVDYFWSEVATDDTDLTGDSPGASITLTPIAQGDYLVMSYAQFDVGQTTQRPMTYIRVATDADPDDADNRKVGYSSSSTSAIHALGLTWTRNLTAAEHTLLEAAITAGSTAGDAKLHSAIFMLRLECFRQYALDATDAAVNLGNTNYATALASVSMTPSREAPCWLTAFAKFDRNNAAREVESRTQLDNADNPPNQTTPNWQFKGGDIGNDEDPWHGCSVDVLSAASHTLDVDGSADSTAGTPQAEYRMALMIELELRAREFSEPLGLTEALDPQLQAGEQFNQGVDDTLSLTEAQTRQAQKTLAETVSLAEAVSARTGKALADALALSEGLTKETRRAILETVVATEALVLQAAKAQAENLSLSENLTSSKVVLESVADTVTLTESLARLIGKAQAETLAPSEALTRLTARLQEETVTLTEAQVREARKTLAELLGFTEALITGVFLKHSVDDTLGLTEDLQAETLTAHQEAETLVLTEAQQRVIGRALQETLGLTETRMVAIAKSVGDLVSLEETLARLMTRRFEEAPAFAEALTANIGGRLPDFDWTEARPTIRARSFSAAIGHRGMVPLGASTRAVEDA